jgi:hypothetical protein
MLWLPTLFNLIYSNLYNICTKLRTSVYSSSNTKGKRNKYRRLKYIHLSFEHYSECFFDGHNDAFRKIVHLCTSG